MIEKIVIEKARIKDAEVICQVQSETWLATYPNPQIGISEQAIRKRIDGHRGQKIAGRINKWRSIIKNSGPATSQTYVAIQAGQIIAFGSARPSGR